MQRADIQARGLVLRWAAVVGPVLVTLVLAGWSLDRQLGYDESVTVGAFVKAPTFREAVTRQVVANNHQLASAVGWAMRSLGIEGEAGLRLFPVLCLATTTALLAWACVRRYGPLTGLVAGLVLATTPLVVLNGRDIRGYAPMLLAATASSILLGAARTTAPVPRRLVTAYVVIATLGVTAQLYMLLVLATQTAFAATDPLLKPRRWWRWSAVAALIGLVVQLPLILGILDAARGRTWRPTFPLDLGFDLGGGSLVALACTVVLVGVWGARAWRTSGVLVAASMIGGLIAVTWLVAPTDLYPRFYLWVCPAIAVAVALGATRLNRCWPRGPSALGPVLAVILIAAQLGVVIPAVAREGLASREGAEILAAIEDAGGVPCVVAPSAEPLSGYLEVRMVSSVEGTDGCSAVLSLVEQLDAPIFPALRGRYSTEVLIGSAEEPGRVFTDEPAPCVSERPPPGCWHR